MDEVVWDCSDSRGRFVGRENSYTSLLQPKRFPLVTKNASVTRTVRE